MHLQKSVLYLHIESTKVSQVVSYFRPDWLRIQILLENHLYMPSGMMGIGALHTARIFYCYMGRPQRTNKPIKTYIMTDMSGYFKIGCAVNFKRRWKEFKCCNPTIYIYAISDLDCEEELHKKYSQYNIGGEWFLLSARTLQSIIKQYKFKIL